MRDTRSDGRIAHPNRAKPNNSDPLDEVISDDNNYLYVLEGTYGGVVGLRIASDGSLTQVTAILGTPSTSSGMAGY